MFFRTIDDRAHAFLKRDVLRVYAVDAVNENVFCC